MIQFNLFKLSSTESNFVISNFLGFQNSDLLLKSPNGDVLANYKFVVPNGNNQFSFPMPKNAPNEIELTLSVNDYSQDLIIQLPDSETSPEEFPIGAIAILSLIGVGIIKFALPRIRFKNTMDLENKEEEIEPTTEIEDIPVEMGNPSTD